MQIYSFSWICKPNLNSFLCGGRALCDGYVTFFLAATIRLRSGGRTGARGRPLRPAGGRHQGHVRVDCRPHAPAADARAPPPDPRGANPATGLLYSFFYVVFFFLGGCVLIFYSVLVSFNR